MLHGMWYAAISTWPGHGLLVTGGTNRDGVLTSTAYLSTSGQWTRGPELPEKITSHCQVTVGSDIIIAGIIVILNNCKGLIVILLGGWPNVASAYKLSGQQGTTWKPLPSMAKARYGHACLAHQGHFYAIGGNGGNVEKMDLSTMTWETGPGLDTFGPFTNGQATLYQNTIFLVYRNGKVLKLNTEDKWEEVADIGWAKTDPGSIFTRQVFPAPIVGPGVAGC